MNRKTITRTTDNIVDRCYASSTFINYHNDYQRPMTAIELTASKLTRQRNTLVPRTFPTLCYCQEQERVKGAKGCVGTRLRATERHRPYEITSDVKSSRPDCPRGRNFVLGLDLGLNMLSSASSSSSGIWPRHVLRLCNLASSICVFNDKAPANDLHSTIHPMPSQYKFTIYSHLTCLDDYWQNVCRGD